MSVTAGIDAALLTRIRSRDPRTLESIVREYLPQIVRAARAAGLTAQEADDAAQAVFTTFLEKAPAFEGRSHVRTWLFGILYRKVFEVRRVIDRDRNTDAIDDVMESRFDTNGSWIRPPRPADADVHARQVREGIAGCLEDLAAKQRMAFVLREVEGMSTDDICKILDVTGTHLGVLLFRARNRLRECLETKGIGA